MRSELREIQKRTGVTFIYITHDQGEALTMSDRIGVMSRGLRPIILPDGVSMAALPPAAAMIRPVKRLLSPTKEATKALAGSS